MLESGPQTSTWHRLSFIPPGLGGVLVSHLLTLAPAQKSRGGFLSAHIVYTLIGGYKFALTVKDHFWDELYDFLPG